MSTFIIIVILILIGIYAFKDSVKHFKGEGDCCGSSHDSGMKYLDKVKDQKKVNIKGIHCQNCENKIRSSINKVPYLSCTKIKNNQVIIQSSQDIEDQKIKDIIEKLGYQVLSIEKDYFV